MCAYTYYIVLTGGLMKEVSLVFDSVLQHRENLKMMMMIGVIRF